MTIDCQKKCINSIFIYTCILFSIVKQCIIHVIDLHKMHLRVVMNIQIKFNMHVLCMDFRKSQQKTLILLMTLYVRMCIMHVDVLVTLFGRSMVGSDHLQ